MHFWECLCDCGNLKVVSSDNLVNGGTKSCGCIKRSRRSAWRGSFGDDEDLDFTPEEECLRECLRIDL
jgi:hypothetical protein